MTIIHKQLALEEAEPDMILSDALFDQQGQILLPKGTVLTEQMLASLARHEVAWLRIEMGEMTPEEEMAQRAYFSQQIDHIFRQHDTSAAAQELKQHIRTYRLGEESA